MGLRNVDMQVLKNPSNFRKLAMGNWDGVGDPQIYGMLDLDCTKALLYLEKLREEHKVKVTINHVFGRVIALMLKKYPQVNGLIANRRIYLRQQVNIFFQVGLEDAETELVGICVRNADTKGLVAFAEDMIAQAEAVRKNAAHPMRKAQKPFHYIPWRLMSFVVKLIGWLQYDWNLNLAWAGIPKDPFGSVMITAVGTLGFEFVFVPLTHIGRTPMQLAVGKVTPRPVVVDNQVVVRPHMSMCCTFDHRFADGILGSKMAHFVTELFENVDRYSDLLEGKVSLDNYPLFPPKQK
jgi:pyruvate dehydrogenase E2 component (dihydrolipoamide acetyltransferase)